MTAAAASSNTVRRSPRSSVHRALGVVGDRWSQLVVDEAFRGATRFEEFRARTGAPRNTLANRLTALVRHGVLERSASREGGAQRAYVLTPMGRALHDHVLLAWSWGIRWSAVAPTGPTSLVHSGCGKAMLAVATCAHCGDDLKLHACTHRPGPGTGVETVPATRQHRRRQPGGSSRQPLDVVDITGDRWTGLVVSSQFFGAHRFDAIQSMLDIATNILSDRLRALVASGVLERRLYQIAPQRHEYWLTQKGRDLYAHALALLLWGDAWLAGRRGPPLVIVHRSCGRTVGMKVVCSECREPLPPGSVEERRTRPGRAQTAAR